MALKRAVVGGAVLLATVALPVIGALIAGHDFRSYVQFPPRLEIPTGYPQFSWVAFVAIGALLTGIAASWWRALGNAAKGPSRTTRDTSQPSARAGTPARRFPAWGWVAIAWVLAWWVLAWNRFAWFEAAQRYTFFPLWLGFIVAVNAWTERRRGSCLMRRAPASWLALFAVSAAFWWIFEWLNRFARNWHYLAVDDFDAVGYAIHATLCFSTVLPAVAAVRETLGTFQRFVRLLVAGPAWRWLVWRSTGLLLVLGGLASLLLTGAQPLRFYPALWVAPLALAWGLLILGPRPGVPAQISRGDWRTAGAWMVAALLCGFWWELWNWHSLAKWIYTVPFVERWHVFEMPLLGYAGYLPFGIECLLVTEWIIADEELAPAIGRGTV